MHVILITNDDGITAPGIKALAKTLASIGEIYVIAPDGEQSAVAHSLTLHRPLRHQKVRRRVYCINGTPTDCVIIGVNKILPVRPDIIVSGINHGANLGDNITYSGTVAAAIEGTLLGIPSVAVSLATENHGAGRQRGMAAPLKRAAAFAAEFVVRVIEKGLPHDTLLNVNVPDSPEIRGVKITRQGKLIYEGSIQVLHDPRGREYYWIGGGTPQWEAGDDTDIEAVHKGFVSVTPVHLDLTNYPAIRKLKKDWNM